MLALDAVMSNLVQKSKEKKKSRDFVSVGGEDDTEMLELKVEAGVLGYGVIVFLQDLLNVFYHNIECTLSYNIESTLS